MFKACLPFDFQISDGLAVAKVEWSTATWVSKVPHDDHIHLLQKLLQNPPHQSEKKIVFIGQIRFWEHNILIFFFKRFLFLESSFIHTYTHVHTRTPQPWSWTSRLARIFWERLVSDKLGRFVFRMRVHH